MAGRNRPYSERPIQAPTRQRVVLQREGTTRCACDLRFKKCLLIQSLLNHVRDFVDLNALLLQRVPIADGDRLIF